MDLDPEIAAMMPADAPDISNITPQEARALHSAIGGQLAAMAREVGPVRDFSIDTASGPLAMRLYRPSGAEGPVPLVIFLHGGGWIGGDLDTHEVLCREMVHGADCAVVAVDYRLAPEHPFPAPVEDCLAAVEYVLDHAAELEADPGRIAIAGDSAGGNLAAVITQLVRGRPGPGLMFQLLAYPGTDLRVCTPAYVECADGPGLTTEGIAWCLSHYLPRAGDILDPRASPILAKDLSGLPPAHIITAALDPLRDDGEAYGRKLIEAGVPVTTRRYLGLPHGFLSLPPNLTRVRAGLDDVCRALAQAFGR